MEHGTLMEKTHQIVYKHGYVLKILLIFMQLGTTILFIFLDYFQLNIYYYLDFKKWI